MIEFIFIFFKIYLFEFIYHYFIFMKFALSIYYGIYIFGHISYDIVVYINYKILSLIYNDNYNIYNYYKNNLHELDILLLEWI